MTSDTQKTKKPFLNRRRFLWTAASGTAVFAVYKYHDYKAQEAIEQLAKDSSIRSDLLDTESLVNGDVTIFDGGTIVSGRKDYPRTLTSMSDLAWDDITAGKVGNISTQDMRRMWEQPPMDLEKALGRTPMKKGDPYAIIRIDKDVPVRLEGEELIIGDGKETKQRRIAVPPAESLYIYAPHHKLQLTLGMAPLTLGMAPYQNVHVMRQAAVDLSDVDFKSNRYGTLTLEDGGNYTLSITPAQLRAMREPDKYGTRQIDNLTETLPNGALNLCDVPGYTVKGFNADATLTIPNSAYPPLKYQNGKRQEYYRNMREWHQQITEMLKTPASWKEKTDLPPTDKMR